MDDVLLYGRKVAIGRNLTAAEWDHIRKTFNIYMLAELRITKRLKLRSVNEEFWNVHAALWIMIKDKNIRIWQRPEYARAPNWEGR